MKLLTIATSLAIILNTMSANAAQSCTVVCNDIYCQQGSSTLLSTSYTSNGCAADGFNKFTIPGDSSGKEYSIRSCNSACSCGSTTITFTITGSNGLSCDATYTQCKSASCTNCISDTSWSAAGTGYQKKVSRSCNCGTCSESTSYQCAAGYYGSSTNGTSGCTACGNGATSPAGTTSQSGCYIPSGSAFSDSTGSGSYTGNCYY